MTRYTIGCAALAVLFLASLSKASVLTGHVQITSGGAGLDEYHDSASFELYGPNFSARVETLGDMGPFQNGALISGSILAEGGSLSCEAQSGEYMGVAAACFGPFDLDPTTPGFQPAWNTADGIFFTPVGAPTTDANGDEISQFTASGELIGFTPADCAQSLPISCTELWDVTFTGQGTMTLYNQGNGYFYALGLDFQPTASAPESPTAALLLIGSLLVVFSTSRLRLIADIKGRCLRHLAKPCSSRIPSS